MPTWATFDQKICQEPVPDLLQKREKDSEGGPGDDAAVVDGRFNRPFLPQQPAHEQWLSPARSIFFAAPYEHEHGHASTRWLVASAVPFAQ